MAEPTAVANEDNEGQPTPSPDDGPEPANDQEEQVYEGLVEASGDTQEEGAEDDAPPADGDAPVPSEEDGGQDETTDGPAEGTDEDPKQGEESDGDVMEGETEEVSATEPLEIELPEPTEGAEASEAVWTDTPVSREDPVSTPAKVVPGTTNGRGKSDPWSVFANIEESLSLLALLSLALLSFTVLVIYRFNRLEGIQNVPLFNSITILVGLAWAAFSLLGYGYLRNQSLRETRSPEWDAIRVRSSQATIAVLGIGLFFGMVSIASPSHLGDRSVWELLGPLWLGILLFAPFLSLLSTGHISDQRYRPVLLLTLGALILGPGIWMLGNTGDFADSGGPQFWDHREYLEFETIRALMLLAGGAMVLGGFSSFRHPSEFYYPWTLGCIIIAGVVGLRLGDLTFEMGTLIPVAGGGLLIVGGLIGWLWRTREIFQRQRVIQAGMRAMERGKPVKALSLLDHAFRLASRDGVLLDQPQLWAQKGAALSQQRKYRRALVFLGVALELDPTDELVWFERGKLYSSLKRWQGAVECYSRAVSLKHDHIEAWLALSEAHLKINANQEAQAAFGRVTQLAPRNIKGWLGLGRANAALGQVRQAVQAFDTASRIDAEAVPPYLAKAQVYYSLKLWEKAQQAYEMVIHLDPKSSEGWWKMAGCYLELRQPQMALNALNNYIDLEPKRVNGLLRRAALHYDEGEYGEAISDIHLAVELDPENEKALQLKRIVLSHLDSRGKWR